MIYLHTLIQYYWRKIYNLFFKVNLKNKKIKSF